MNPIGIMILILVALGASVVRHLLLNAYVDLLEKEKVKQKC